MEEGDVLMEVQRAVARGLAVAGLLLAVGCGSPTQAPAPVVDLPVQVQKPRPRHDCSVTLYGDSILYGVVGATLDRLPETPAAVIERMRPSYFVVDKTVPGDFVLFRSDLFMRDRIQTRLVVFQHGMNDAGRRLDYAEPLRKMVRRAKAVGKTPIITGISRAPIGTRDAYDAMARRVAAEEGVLFADWGAVPYAEGDLADAVHPHQAYSTRLAEQLVKALDQAAPECR
jgi:lysophospholipase L1-like esterase